MLQALRPAQWTKNLFVFAGIVFSLKLFVPALLFKVVLAFVLFCVLSGAVYLINDVRDIESDKKHPVKKLRPIASGKLSIFQALIIAVILALFSLLAAFHLDPSFALVALTYFLLMILYNYFLREMVILDVFSIAAGFVLRAVAGVVVIGVELSPWLIICTILLSLFIALGKRRHELITLAGTAVEHRRILDEYNPQLLDQMISAVAGSTVMAYALYTLWPETIAKFKTHNLVYSVPFVLYGIFRYLYLIYQKEQGGKPEEILLTDIPLMIDLAFWVVSLMVIIYLK
ncbi:MAG: decaprenyl-phosphate phosphoribosyltransferase [Candidatus Margulisbacteria bacterium]|nr:decaprenyl-phosphate phosphoribosyltransferase [Candidatus Margulisiibacteriota bacterium]